MSAAVDEHQPRERAVACQGCGAQTWTWEARCDRCAALVAAWASRAADLKAALETAAQEYREATAVQARTFEAAQEAEARMNAARRELNEHLAVVL